MHASPSNHRISSTPPVFWHDPNMRAFLRLPRNQRRARHRPLDRHRHRAHRDDHKVSRHRKIMDQCRERPANHLRSNDLAGCVRDIKLDIAGDSPGRKIRKEKHLTRRRIDLRMRRHVSRQLAVEGPAADRLERRGIQFDRCMTFFKSQQPVRMPDDVRIRDAIRSHSGDTRIRIRRHTRSAEQRSAGSVLEIPLLRPHPTIAVRNLALMHAERMHHSVPIERIVIAARRKLRIGPMR